MTDAFDADVVIYGATAGHPLGERVAALLPVDPMDESEGPVGIGSVLLIPEVLAKPTREGSQEELAALASLLSRLDLLPVDQQTAQQAASLGAVYRLRAADAVHLATAIGGGADRFITNNRRDFPKSIADVDITYPEDLPEADPPLG